MQYLDTQARLDRYSVANTVLIMQQLPEATQLKDYKDWSETGVTVKRGSKSLMILEPKEYSRENGSVGISYNVKRVFDISQTNARRRNAPTVNNDPAKIVAAMLETSQIDYEISDKIPIENAAAYYEPESNMLLVRENVGDATKLFQAVAQELSLAEIAYNSDSYSRSEALYPAKCAAYMLCRKYGVDLISLIAPTSADRAAMIAKDADGFIYIVSSLGVTGERAQITTDISKLVSVIRENTSIPCAVGFGISTPEQAKSMSQYADGVIVGSAIVRKIAQYGKDSAAPVGEFVNQMKNAIR